MIRRADITVFPDGVTPEPGVYITIKDDTGAVAPLYDDVGAPKANPFTSSLDGTFYYNIADGASGTFIEEYRLSLSESPRTIRAVSLTTEEVLNGILTPEMFAAAGDGVTNDTVAFQQLAAAINAQDGGVICYRPGAIYIVGIQTLANNGTWMFQGQDICRIVDCSRGVTVYGNGARMKLAAGMKFGTFNAAGAPTVHDLPYLGGDKSAPMVEGMLVIRDCTGFVSVHDLEFDGNIAGITLGGQYGDTGYQLAADGLWLYDNSGGEFVRGVRSHHHARDGAIILGAPASLYYASSVIQIQCEDNARQGVSFIGGKGYTFIGSRFNRSGMGPFSSAPGSGFDLEAEIGTIRDIHFIECEFSDCNGASMVADSGDIADISFTRCKFVSGNSWAAWPCKPRLKFSDCRFVGALNLSNFAQKFFDCTFSTLTADHPRGVIAVFGVAINSAGSTNLALFERCTFTFTNNAISAFSINYATYRDCTITVGTNSGGGMPGSSFEGVTDITTGADLAILTYVNGGVLCGQITYNGTRWRKASAVYDPASLADGARATTNIAVPAARLGRDELKVSFSLDLQGVNLRAYVVSDGNATVVFENETGGVVDLGSGTITVSAVDLDT